MSNHEDTSGTSRAISRTQLAFALGGALAATGLYGIVHRQIVGAPKAPFKEAQIKAAQDGMEGSSLKAARKILSDMELPNQGVSNTLPAKLHTITNSANNENYPAPVFVAEYQASATGNLINISADSPCVDADCLIGSEHSYDISVTFDASDNNPLAEEVARYKDKRLTLANFESAIEATSTLKLVAVGDDADIDSNSTSALTSAPGVLFEGTGAYSISTAFANYFLAGPQDYNSKRLPIPPPLSAFRIGTNTTMQSTERRVMSDLNPAIQQLTAVAIAAESAN